MAALRHGVHTVIIPKANEKDLEQIDQTVRKALNFVLAETIETVLETALNRSGVSLPPVCGEIPANKPARKPEIRQ